MGLHVPRLLKSFAQIFADHGYQCYLVGGAVRDMAAGITPADYDVATDARPEEVMRFIQRTIPTGLKHGTVTALYKGKSIEVTTFRVEGGYSDARRPDSVSFTGSIEEDLARRDFTVNGMALHCLTGKLLDPHNGMTDLKNHVIRAIGDPEERFGEDALRLLRACRFAAQLASRISDATFAAMRLHYKSLDKVSAERIQDEFMKTLKAPTPSVGLIAMEQSGVLSVIVPELSRCRGVVQDGGHGFDVLDHLYAACDGAPEENLVVRISALFHDIGKPAALIEKDGIVQFHGHDKRSAEISASILERFKCSKALVSGVANLVDTHMWNYSQEWSDAAVRRFVKRIGIANLDDAFALRSADRYGMKRKASRDEEAEELRIRIEDLISADTALQIRDLQINGNDLQAVGIPRGPALGIVLNELLETVIDDPRLNTKEDLLRIGVKFYEERVKKGTF